MGDGYNGLRTDLKEFENVIRNLSIGINSSGVLWSDTQYEQLAEKIGAIASLSKDVIQAGQRCENAIKKFESIALEV